MKEKKILKRLYEKPLKLRRNYFQEKGDAPTEQINNNNNIYFNHSIFFLLRPYMVHFGCLTTFLLGFHFSLSTRVSRKFYVIVICLSLMQLLTIPKSQNLSVLCSDGFLHTKKPRTFPQLASPASCLTSKSTTNQLLSHMSFKSLLMSIFCHSQQALYVLLSNYLLSIHLLPHLKYACGSN